MARKYIGWDGRSWFAHPGVRPASFAGPRRRGGKRRLVKAARLFGPFGPFSPVWRGVFKYAIAAAVTGATLDRAERRFGHAERGRRAWDSVPWDRIPWDRIPWDRLVARRDRNSARDDRNSDEDDRVKEGKMPRFGRGFPGSEGPKGPQGPRGRRFDRGDVKYVLLDLLREGPRHGYDMIKEMEKRSGGFYTPSPGSVYPTLQMLEDQGFVTSTTVDGKRTYRLTDAGYAFIDERSDRTDDARGRAWTEGGPARDDMRSVGREAGELARSLRDAVRSYAPDARQLNEIRDVIGETRKRIEAILVERQEPPRDEDRDKPVTV